MSHFGKVMASEAVILKSLGLRPLALQLHVILQPHPLDHLELGFERVDVLFLVGEDAVRG